MSTGCPKCENEKKLNQAIDEVTDELLNMSSDEFKIQSGIEPELPPILFLDIDGVVNTIAQLGFKEHHHASMNEYFIHLRDKTTRSSTDILGETMAAFFCPKSLHHLKNIVEKTDCKIVISSTWRLGGKTLDQMKSWFASPTIKNAIIGKTPRLGVYDGEDFYTSAPRGMECSKWLKDNGYPYDFRRVAILDDDSDSYPMNKAWILVNGTDGINTDNYKQAVKLLTEGFKYGWEE